MIAAKSTLEEPFLSEVTIARRYTLGFLYLVCYHKTIDRILSLLDSNYVKYPNNKTPKDLLSEGSLKYLSEFSKRMEDAMKIEKKGLRPLFAEFAQKLKENKDASFWQFNSKIHKIVMRHLDDQKKMPKARIFKQLVSRLLVELELEV